ncbi:MAG TPA: lysophospholipid acyltransferase family protein [Sandaracinaceae bacterium]
MRTSREVGRHAVIDAVLGRKLADRLDRLVWRDAGHGYDRLGLSPNWVRASVAASRFLYEAYFRVTSHGIENVPRRGAALVAANHSGMLPIDGAMLYLDLVRRLDPPRVPRIVADLFVPRLPFVFTFMNRIGVVGGDRRTMHHLLESGELVVVFPEGTPGIGKPFSERYRLRPFRVGHAELALRHRAPVVPVGIVGAEEQWPQLGRIERFHLFGAPYLPVPATPFPLPVRYHVWYGEPLLLHERFSPADADDPDVAEEAASVVQTAVQLLVERGLEERKGVFR